MELYRPKPGQQEDNNLYSVWSQQYRQILQEQIDFCDHTTKTEPREKCLTDLSEWITANIKTPNYSLTLITDANQKNNRGHGKLNP